MAWDTTCLPNGPCTTEAHRESLDSTPAGARAVYGFLNIQAKKVSSYASSPIWSVVDGPWKLTQLTSGGQATFVPNPKYDGPDRPHLAKFVELPFTSEEAEFSVLKAGKRISVGYVPRHRHPSRPVAEGRGLPAR